MNPTTSSSLHQIREEAPQHAPHSNHFSDFLPFHMHMQNDQVHPPVSAPHAHTSHHRLQGKLINAWSMIRATISADPSFEQASRALNTPYL
jgi:hypothetical protein